MSDLPADRARALLQRVAAAAAGGDVGTIDEAIRQIRRPITDGRLRDASVAEAATAAAEACDDHPGLADRTAMLHAIALHAARVLEDPDRARRHIRALRRQGGPTPLGPFLLHGRLGQGAMGQVWAARHAASGREVAVKVLAGASSVRRRSALQVELRALARLDHPAVVGLLDAGVVDAGAAAANSALPAGTPWMAVERVHGGELTPWCGHLPWATCRSVLLQLLDGLAHAHARGLTHLDVKPANVLLDGTTAAPVVRLADFGIARLRDDAPAPRVSGTPMYMAPEQYLVGQRDVGPATDLYALGCLATQLVCGRPPFVRATFDEQRAAHLEEAPARLEPVIAVPAGLDAWVGRLLAKSVGDRFQWAADAARALAQLGPATGGAARFETEPADATLTLVLPLDDLELTPATLVDDSERCPIPQVHVPADWHRRAVDRPPWLDDADPGLARLRQARPVGFERERALLWATLRHVVERRQPAVVALVGPAGSGTSHLARWLAERAHEVGAARTLAADLDIGDLRDLGRSWFGLAGLTGHARLHRIHLGLSRLGEVDAVEVDAWAEYLSDAPAPAGVLARLASRLVGSIAADRPVILQLHSVDHSEDALELAREVQRAAGAVLVVLTARHLADEVLDAEDWLVISPGPLDADEIADLVQGQLRGCRDLGHQLAHASRGNPGAALAMLHALVANGDLIEGPAGLEQRSDAQLRVPTHPVRRRDLARLIQGRTAEERLALQVAAALSEGCTVETFEATCVTLGLDAADLLSSLSSLGLLLPHRGGGLQLGDPVLSGLLEPLPTDASALARACADALEEGGEPHPLRLGELRLAAGQPHETIRVLLAPMNELRGARGHAFARRALGVVEAALEAAEVPSDDPRWGEVELQRILAGRFRHDLHDTLARVQALLERAAGRPAWRGLRAAAIRLRGRAFSLLGELAAATSDLETARSEFMLLGDLEGAAACLERLSWFAESQGHTEEALTLVDRGLAGEGSQWVQGQLWVRRGRLLVRLGRLDEAMVALDQAGLQAARSHSAWGALEQLRADICVTRGDLDGAEAALVRGIQSWESRGELTYAARLNLAWLRLLQGRYAEAESMAARLVGQLRTHAAPLLLGALALRVAALADRPEDELAPALQALDESPSAGSIAEVVALLGTAAERAEAAGLASRAAALRARASTLSES